MEARRTLQSLATQSLVLGVKEGYGRRRVDGSHDHGQWGESGLELGVLGPHLSFAAN